MQGLKQFKKKFVLIWLWEVFTDGILLGMHSKDVLGLEFWQEIYLTMWQSLYSLATLYFLLLGTFITKGKRNKRNCRQNQHCLGFCT
jgi:hypothetical protein